MAPCPSSRSEKNAAPSMTTLRTLAKSTSAKAISTSTPVRKTRPSRRSAARPTKGRHAAAERVITAYSVDSSTREMPRSRIRWSRYNEKANDCPGDESAEQRNASPTIRQPA